MPDLRKLMNHCQVDGLQRLDEFTRTWIQAGLEEDEVLVCLRHAQEMLPKLWYAQGQEDG